MRRLQIHQMQAVDSSLHQVGSGACSTLEVALGSGDLGYLLEVENHWSHEKICIRQGAMQVLLMSYILGVRDLHCGM